MATTKKDLRAHFKALRAAIPVDERARIDAAIAAQVASLPEFARADVLFAYLSFGAEVETRGIIEQAWSSGKQVLLPRCIPNSREMAWYRVESFEGLVKSPLGVEEPAGDPACEVDPAAVGPSLVLVPGLTFDTRGFRLGYGGGFYDTFLASAGSDRAQVGLCREAQFSQQVEALDAHDLPVQIVVTEDRVVRCGA